eukprot:scaffold374_cov271-Pinguiococcus_pyrenoidosus.AAC.17
MRGCARLVEPPKASARTPPRSGRMPHQGVDPSSWRSTAHNSMPLGAKVQCSLLQDGGLAAVNRLYPLAALRKVPIRKSAACAARPHGRAFLLQRRSPSSSQTFVGMSRLAADVHGQEGPLPRRVACQRLSVPISSRFVPGRESPALGMSAACALPAHWLALPPPPAPGCAWRSGEKEDPIAIDVRCPSGDQAVSAQRAFSRISRKPPF